MRLTVGHIFPANRLEELKGTLLGEAKRGDHVLTNPVSLECCHEIMTRGRVAVTSDGRSLPEDSFASIEVTLKGVGGRVKTVNPGSLIALDGWIGDMDGSLISNADRFAVGKLLAPDHPTVFFLVPLPPNVELPAELTSA